MDWYTRNVINEIADAVREEYHIHIPIENFQDIIENRLGGRLVEESYLKGFADARIEKHERTFVIRVLRGSNERRRRFSLAHELGHLFIHMGYKIDDELWEKSDGVFNRLDSGELEFQANEFAAALLMPEKQFIEKMYEYSYGNYYDMDKVADYFGVSVQAAINRGKWLNLLSWG